MNKKSNLNVYGLEDVFERLIKESEKNNTKYSNQNNHYFVTDLKIFSI